MADVAWHKIQESVERVTRNDVFTMRDVIADMRAHGTRFATSTIRTQICSRLCPNAPTTMARRTPSTSGRGAAYIAESAGRANSARHPLLATSCSCGVQGGDDLAGVAHR